MVCNRKVEVMIFYSPSRRGFFDDALTGPRELQVIDEEALATARKSANAADAANYRAAKREAEENAEDAGQVVTIDRTSFTSHVDAVEADPPMKSVANPDTLLPADAVPVTSERHSELMAGQAKGFAIVPGADGQPELGEQPALSNDEVIASVRRRRDALLAASDYTQLPDAVTAAKRKLWAEHRKALRELPAEVEAMLAKGGSAADIVFPEAPAT
jgi:hypothetical protein